MDPDWKLSRLELIYFVELRVTLALVATIDTLY